MVVSLIGKSFLSKITLPSTVSGNYWLCDNENGINRKLVNIDAVDGKWQIRSGNGIKIIDFKDIEITDYNIRVSKREPKIIEKANILDYSIFAICFNRSKEVYLIYSSPTYERDFVKYDIKNTREIYLGNQEGNQIIYKNRLVSNVHAKLYYENGRWCIQNYDKKIGTFVNGKPVYLRNRMLFNGDVIFILGLKIIIIGNSLYVNSLQGLISVDREYLNLSQEQKIEIKDKINIKNVEDDEIEIYSNNDYFFRVPRIKNVIEKKTLKIDLPPQKQENQQMPLFLTLGSTLSMSMVTIVSLIMTIQNRANGTATKQNTIVAAITCFAMLIGMLLFPVLISKYEKKQKKKREEKRQKKYGEYINSKIKFIDEEINLQRKILFENNPSVEECMDIIVNRKPELWERKIKDEDFLNTRLGIGNVPLDIDIQLPEEQFRMDEDNLIDILSAVRKKSKIIEKAPIIFSLVQSNISAIISNNSENLNRYVQNLIIQFVTFHSYEDLKIVCLLKKENDPKREYLKLCPHLWSNDKKIRFYATEYSEMEEISKYLEEEFKYRERNEEEDYTSYKPYYLIITDDYKKIEGLNIIKKILESQINYGFSLLCLTDNLLMLPNECKTFIEVAGNKGIIFENELAEETQVEFEIDNSLVIFYERLVRKLANIPIKYSSNSGINALPENYSFLEMYDVGRIDQLNVLERWNRNDSTMSLKAPIGIDSSGRIIDLDIHERFHGPHGLIAGSTGSGKSELIITYILSLAVNYHPDDVSFILIDYKGGGLTGAFEKRNIKLPHLVGTITNIDTVGLQRALTSIQSELRRRQRIFYDARTLTNEGTIDIYKYQRLYHQGIVTKPVPHLLIICDEFAELKQQQEEFLDELISVARIGRSLGVHLILATQKPAGIVNDQIRSNSKFGICLKVQEREDSIDVIKRPDAAEIKKVGQFYLQVGNNEYFVLGQCAWSGAPYYPTSKLKKKISNSIEFVSDIGAVIKEVDNGSVAIQNSQGEELTNVVEYLYKLAESEQIKTEQLWLNSIPEIIYIDNIKNKYKYKQKAEGIEIAIGEFDDPYNQRQGILTLDLMNQGNILVYGNAESGKENLLSTIIYECIDSYTPDDLNIYILDFGTEALKIFKNSKMVGDVVFLNDEEKLERFFEQIKKEISKRKEILSNYNGNYKLFNKTTDNKLPYIEIIINNFETFMENYINQYEDMFLAITRDCSKYGISFILTASTYGDVRYRLMQNFKYKIALQLNNQDDYYNIFERIGKKRPSHIFGRGMAEVDKEIYEFQTAKICEAEKYNIRIQEIITKTNKKFENQAKEVSVLPDKILFKDIIYKMKNLSTIPIGIYNKNLDVCTYNFKKNLLNIIISKNIEESVNLTKNILEEISELPDTDIYIFDAERAIRSQKFDIKEQYKEFKNNLKEIVSNNTQNIVLIIGIDKFLNDLQEEEMTFSDLLKETEEYECFNFIIVENMNKLKAREYETWYKSYVYSDEGIWVGNGITEQYLLSTSSTEEKLTNICGSSFGYIIQKGKAKLIKFVEL